MRFPLLTGALAVCLCAASGTSMTVAQLVSFIKSSIELKQNDGQVGKFLRGVRMTERLDERTIETLQGMGAGPKTVEGLRFLRDQSQSLAQPQTAISAEPPPPIPPPTSEEQAQIISDARENSLNYTKSLPDFICTQVTRRYVDPTGSESWQLMDTLTTRLSYFQQKEDYKLILVNNRVTDQSYHALGGASSTGEFGSMLREIFEPKTGTRFEWDHWAIMRKKDCYVFAYRVSQANSQWHIDYERRMSIVSGYHGLVYIDLDTHRVLHLSLEADTIPPGFPVQMARTTLDYEYTTIGDREFLLPLRAQVRMKSDRVLTRNDVEFRLYRKFSAEAQISYDTPEPLPEDQTKEQKPPK